MTDHRKLVTLLVPVYNEQEVLPHLYERVDAITQSLPAYDFELLLVDDGSSDESLRLMREFSESDERVAYVSLSRNFGKEIAMLAGLDHVRGDCVVILDADLQDPPELIPQMLSYWEEGYEDVFARRRSREGESWMKKTTSKVFYRVLERSTHIPIQRDTGDFRLLDRRCVDALTQFRESERYTKGMFDWIGFRKKEITYDREPRHAGQTKWNYRKLFNFAIDGLTSFTTAPLRWSAMLGFVISAVAFVYMIVIVVRALMGVATVDGYPSLMAVILFLGGVQLLSLGIIGEYLGRVFMETKNRPPYFVGESRESARGSARSDD
ncbi:glycosyltransferase family 2 protein [Microbacterium sp. NPDC003461]